MVQILRFHDIDAPVYVDGGDVLELVPRVLPKWPFQIVERADTEPFFSIRQDSADRYLCTSHITGAAPRRLDRLNAVCDMVAAMSYALVASQPRYLCLHAAAVVIGGRLVVFPSTRRAGKSTLTACLAQKGHAIFTDDALPVTTSDEGHLVGRAMGISPRVRLPFPDFPGDGIGEWVAENPGPANAQYKYLSLSGLPETGRHAPLGAVVMLDRDGSGSPSLKPVDPETAMDRLLHQNFTREVHSADVLRLLSRIVLNYPIYGLHYTDAPEAARMLADTFYRWPDPMPSEAGGGKSLARADLARPVPVTVVGDLEYLRHEGAPMAQIGAALYLSEPKGGRIHRLNTVSHAIWTMLETPSSIHQIRDVLAEAFPDVDPAEIERDVTSFMTRLGDAGLIAPA